MCDFEDEYWEAVRERLESPTWYRSDETIIENDCIYIDDDEEELESLYGCGIGELMEGDLLEILDRYPEARERKITSAGWNPRQHSIDYTYQY